MGYLLILCPMCVLAGGLVGFALRDHLAALIHDDWSGPAPFGEDR